MNGKGARMNRHLASTVLGVVCLVAACGVTHIDNAPGSTPAATASAAPAPPKDARTLCVEKIRSDSCPAGTSLDCSESVINDCRPLAEGSIVRAAGDPVGCFHSESITYGCKPTPNMCGPNNVRVRRITRDAIDCSPCGGAGQDCCEGNCSSGLQCSAGICNEPRSCSTERAESYGSTDTNRGGGTIRAEKACLSPRTVLTECRHEEFGMNGGRVDGAHVEGNKCVCTGSFPGRRPFGSGHSAGCRVIATCCNR